MSETTRRRFLRDSLMGLGAVTCVAHDCSLYGTAAKRSATDLVTLGRSGIKATRLAVGTGTWGGRVQRELGQEEFTRVIRHAYDRGARFFDTAAAYRTHEMLATALQGLDRDTYVLQTKMRWRDDPNPLEIIDRFRQELRTDYFDILLLHCTRTGDWPETLKRQMDLLEEAKVKRLIRAHGASCHGLLPLRRMPDCSWLDVAFVRTNHTGAHMDNLSGRDSDPGEPAPALETIRKIHASGIGVIGMKVIGEGDFKDPVERDASIQSVMAMDYVQAVVIGFKSTAEVDEAIDRMNRHLNAHA